MKKVLLLCYPARELSFNSPLVYLEQTVANVMFWRVVAFSLHLGHEHNYCSVFSRWWT